MNILIDQNQLYAGQKVYITTFGKVMEDTIGLLEVNKTGGHAECAKYNYITFRFEKRNDKWLIIPKDGDSIALDKKQALQWAIDYQNKWIGINKSEIQKLEGKVLAGEEAIERYTKELSKL